MLIKLSKFIVHRQPVFQGGGGAETSVALSSSTYLQCPYIYCCVYIYRYLFTIEYIQRRVSY